MAFPQIPTGSRILSTFQTNQAATCTFPDLSGLTKNSGDLLIAIAIGYQSSATANAVWSSWGGGFTEFCDKSSSTGMCIGMAYKISTGSETGTFTVTQAATRTGNVIMFLLSISGAHPTTIPECGTLALGTTAAGNPNAISPSWGAEDTLWMSIGAGGEDGTSGAFNGVTAAPTGPYPYSPSGGNIVSDGTDVVGSINAGVAFAQQNTASGDVGAWTVDLSNARNLALLTAIRPAPSVPFEGWGVPV